MQHHFVVSAIIVNDFQKTEAGDFNMLKVFHHHIVNLGQLLSYGKCLQDNNHFAETLNK